MREPRYADNSQSVSQKTGFSGWPKRKAGRVCRKRIFAASQSKNRLLHLGELSSAFRKIVVALIANDDAAVRVKPPARSPVPNNFKKKAALTFNEVRRALIRAGLLLRSFFFGDVLMIERRSLERIEINQPAMLHLDRIRGIYPCIVVNFHNQGARLSCSTFHIVAFEFDLSFDGFNTTKHCHVVWRDRNSCGVEFVESHAKRRRSS